jgi:hypothetical protein
MFCLAPPHSTQRIHVYQRFGMGDKDWLLIRRLAFTEQLVSERNRGTVGLNQRGVCDALLSVSRRHIFAYQKGVIGFTENGGLSKVRAKQRPALNGLIEEIEALDTVLTWINSVLI